ncbi:hypothetical protein CJF42_23855 [Pseudoalteromonas sp. NBT06-2]|uniref:hypothetical protein n=1 Tax=Pseudoalteromonas sp. NBT06-2 TaxID=2025950 RepID=UPI000BA52DD4|nr:hypothetical protein [Pseudoalteromonas sp. NBT06-2]PAJ71959.1 hypothetical protein CJF42_23855 [Pseudoalteromonas sp. NBT06-2]
MKFENLLNYLDMGVCVEQMQREALVDLVVLFIEIDGVINDTELAFTKKWLKSLTWTSNMSTDTYLHEVSIKCKHAIEHNQVNNFILQRTQNIHDKPLQLEAIKLAEGVSLADGVLSPIEEQAIEFLKVCFDK